MALQMLTLKAEPELIDRLTILAGCCGCSRSELVREAARRLVELEDATTDAEREDAAA